MTFMHNTPSIGWQKICELIDRPEHELRAYGVSIPMPWPSSDVTKRPLVANGCLLTIASENDGISASISDDSQPSGKLPRPRVFSIEGTIDNPVFVEQGGEPKDAGQVFQELTVWARNFALSLR